MRVCVCVVCVGVVSEWVTWNMSIIMLWNDSFFLGMAIEYRH